MLLPSSAPTSAKIVLTTFGSFGDVHPYLALGRELQNRGHRVTIATAEIYRNATQNAGLEFFAVRPDLPDPETHRDFYARVMNPVGGGAKYLLSEIVAPHIRETFADLCEITRDADVFVSHGMSVVAPLVAGFQAQSSNRQSSTRLKWISAVVSPMFLQSVDDPPSLPVFPQMARVPLLGKWASRGWNRWLGNWLAQPLGELQTLRRELGLPPGVSPLFDDAHSPRLVLGLFSPLLAPPQRDWPSQTRAVGFCFYDRDNGELPDELRLFLESGAPPILFTLGASSAMNAGTFWEESARAVALMKCRAIFVTGRELENAPDFASPEVFRVPYVALSAVLPLCASAVHHGGIGTIALCLQAATPMLLVPQAQDQPDNAQRALRAGAARLLTKSKYKAERVARELESLSSTRSLAQRFQDIIARENGAKTACDLIEAELRNEPEASATGLL